MLQALQQSCLEKHLLKAACGVEPIAPEAPGEGLLEGDALPCRVLCARGRTRSLKIPHLQR